MKIKEFMKKNYRAILLIILLSIFILIAKEVSAKEIFYTDKVLYDFLVSHRNPILNTFFVIITELGSAEVLIGVTVFCILFIKNKFYKILIPVNLSFIALVNQILKRVFIRQRPDELRLVEENGYSFPSGHAMASTAFYGLLIIMILKKVQNKKLRNALCIGLTLLVLLIDISRIYVGVHYASDVIAGTCLSIVYLIILNRLLKKFDKI